LFQKFAISSSNSSPSPSSSSSSVDERADLIDNFLVDAIGLLSVQLDSIQFMQY
jgi:hypothetical protein